jgi:hypothetical protein
VGGTPTTADAYNVCLVRVTNPVAAQTEDFLNSLGPQAFPTTPFTLDVCSIRIARSEPLAASVYSIAHILLSFFGCAK